MKVLLLIVCLAIGETTAVHLKRSVGGTSLGIEDAPFFVSIKQRGHHVCGGALITTKHVITAAYCLVDKFGNARHHLEVVSGTARKYDGGTLHKIRHLFIAPGFGLQGFRTDIAVLVLSEHVKSDAKQYPIALPTAELRRRGKAKFIAFASTDNPLENSLLHQLDIQIHPIDFCPGIPPIDELMYSADKFCGISDYYEKTYTGDFGGPLVRNGTVVGILSFIKAPHTLYNYFMDVYKFTDLINESKKCWTSLCNSEAARYISYSST